jgi:hypothetical protein
MPRKANFILAGVKRPNLNIISYWFLFVKQLLCLP